MSQLQIYKASAGSGKTFTITREFVQLLFSNPFDYKHLLAVTFTNKATAEMKGRIIKTLYSLWKDPIENGKPDYMDMLVNQEGSVELVREKAGFILNMLLHDFSRFTVSTIDSFFQRIIRSFMQELGLHSGFKTELDNKKVLQMAIDRLVMQLGQKNRQALRDWLLQSSQENMESGQSWDMTKQLRTLGEEVLSEVYQSFHSSYLEKLNDKQLLDNYKKELRTTTGDIESKIKAFGTNGLAMIEAQELKWDDFASKSRTPFKIVSKWASLADGYNNTEGISKFIDDVSGWPSDKKSAKAKDQMANLYQSGFNELIKEACQFIETHKILYNTSALIQKNFNALAIINDIAAEMDTICTEESVFLLSNANRLLYKVIGENDAPFVYEKSGTVYKHFMIDEFQDTSSLQWNNFKPLIENSLSANYFSMIVGDVKQSIYRWRNSDWKLLADQVQNDFRILGSQTHTLDNNWRSYEKVITFNNLFFELAANHLQANFNGKLANVSDEIADQWRSKIAQAYADVKQQVSPKKIGSGGYVRLEFLDAQEQEEKYDTLAVKRAMEMVKQLVENGSAYNDICVLVRKTDEARLVTNALLSGEYTGQPYPVVSNEALMLSGSVAVNMIVNQLKFIIDPQNDIYTAYVKLYWGAISQSPIPQQVSANEISDNILDTASLLALKGLPLLDLVETLVQQLPHERVVSEGVFLQAFIDATASYVQNETADLASFLLWWNDEGMRQSVSVPEEQDAIRVMTVHKSKGLEFEHVIMPFLDWELNPSRHTSIIWCRDPFEKIDFVPVKYEKEMLESSFAYYYLNELLHQFVDNLNILYVAFTRAKQSLWGIMPSVQTEGKNGEEKLSTVAHLLTTVLGTQASLLGEQAESSDECFEFGSKPQHTSGFGNDKQSQSKTGEFQTISLPNMQSWKYADRIRIFMESENFADTETQRQINQGKILHRLFEQIHNSLDVENAVAKLILEGIIESDKKDELIAHIHQLLKKEQVAPWFDPAAKVLNEIPILHQAQTLRPDRVVISGKKVSVIDYKFGDAHSPKHSLQVRSYMNKITQMGYSDVEGYIWYVTEGKIEKVTQDGQLELFG